MNEIEKLIRSYYEVLWEKRNPEGIRKFVNDDYKRYISPALAPLDIEGQIIRLKGILQSFSYMNTVIEDIAVNGNIVFARLKTDCVHDGVFMGIEPTGAEITNSAMEEFEVRDGRISRHWGGPDTSDIRRQIMLKKEGNR